jgi:UDP-glucose 4-epimerase
MSSEMFKRRVIVTGGAGFIGSHLVAALAAAGDEPIVLDDFSTGDPDNVPGNVAIVHQDVADPITADRIAELRPWGIVHAAAQVSVRRSMLDPARDRAVNLLGTANVIEGARRAGDCRLVFLSTGGGIYGETDDPATEESLPRPKSFYSVHKYAAEKYIDFSGLPAAIARLANVYGPRQRTDLEGGVVAIFTERLTSGLPITIFGSGQQRRDFIHVDDVVTALRTLLDTSLSGLWNVGMGTPLAIGDLLAVMERLIRPAVAVHHEPTRPGDVFSSCLANAKIARDLGWSPQVSLEDGIRHLATAPATSVRPPRERKDTI